MKKVLKWIITLLMPLLLLKCSGWLLNHALYNELPYFTDWQYIVKLLFYFVVAVYLFYLYQSRYSKKERVVLMIPLLYLIFFSLPLGILQNNTTIMTFYGKFYPGYNAQYLLLFAYLVKTIATTVGVKKSGRHKK